MLSPTIQRRLTQRWRERHQKWIPHQAIFEPANYAVDVIPDRMAKPFIEQHHYSGSYPASRLATGLFRQAPVGCMLEGVCLFSVPMNGRAVTKHLGLPANDGVELGRLVLLDTTGFNAESWFVARSFRRLKREKPCVQGVLSYSDPVPRSDNMGRVILRGHVGQVYQALSSTYAGRATARTLLLGATGQVISERALSKIRNEEQGWGYAMRQLMNEGAPPREAGEDLRSWVKRATAGLRRLHHPGNHLYLFGLTDETRRYVATKANPYPRLANENDGGGAA